MCQHLLHELSVLLCAVNLNTFSCNFLGTFAAAVAAATVATTAAVAVAVVKVPEPAGSTAS